MRTLIGIGLLVCGLTGCFTTRVVVSREPSAGPAFDYDGRFHHDGIFGLVEFSDPVNLDTVCPGGVAYVEQETTFIAGLCQALTQNLYNPQAVTVFCKNGKSAETLLDDDGNALAMLPLQ